VVAAVRDGYSTTKELLAHLMEACAVSKPTVERLIRTAVEKQAIKALTRGKFILGRKSAMYLETTA
jgi:predicted transcriptional regulator